MEPQCDEGRPASPDQHLAQHLSLTNSSKVCNACLKSNRVCIGYEEDSSILFRHHKLAERFSASRTPSIPPLVPVHERYTSQLHNDMQNLDDSAIETVALHVFFRVLCVRSADLSISRGFLHGLQSLIEQHGDSSDLAHAARTVASVTIGNKLRRQNLLRQAEHSYGDLLRSLHYALSESEKANTPQTLMTAVLLGLYEVRISSPIPLVCSSHVCSRSSPPAPVIPASM